MILSSSSFLIRVWCSVSIRVLGTRGDSSTLSSRTRRSQIADMRSQNKTQVQSTKNQNPIPKAKSNRSESIVGPEARHGSANAETPVRIRYDAPKIMANLESRISNLNPRQAPLETDSQFAIPDSTFVFVIYLSRFPRL